MTFSSPLIAAETVDNREVRQREDRAKHPENLEFSDATTQEFPSTSQPSPASRSPTKANTFPRSDSQYQQPAPNLRTSAQFNTFPTDRPQTPSTFITPPTPTVHRPESPPQPGSKSSSKGSLSLGTLPGKPTTAVPKEFISHRRTRSAASATKASASVPPLTPHVEEAKTPGGSVIQPGGSGGFFASVFSATHNAVAQISSSFGQQVGSRSRSDTASSAPSKPVLAENSGANAANTTIESGQDGADTQAQKGEPALATLGSGNLSFTHLGIADSSSESPAMSGRFIPPDIPGHAKASIQSGSNSQDDASAVEAAVSAAYGARTPSEKSVPLVTDNTGSRPRSLTSLPNTLNGDAIPQRSVTQATEVADGTSLRRAGSVRSRLSGRGLRHRNSSAAGGAIAAALASSHGAIANPASRRPAGFAVANTKRNKEFHKDFKSVPEDDHLIDDFSAALQRDILLHGRFYISEQHVCFASNILGWTTNLVMSFDEVVAIEKKSTAVIFPNAIVIQTLHAKNVFASFINRDATYELLIRIWRIGHPNLKMTEAGHLLDESAAAKSELAPSPGSTTSSDGDSDDEVEDDPNDPEDAASSAGGPPSITPSEVAETVRSASKVSPSNGSPGQQVNSTASRAPDISPLATVPGQDFPGPATHSVTQCSDGDSHFANQVLDTTVPAPLGRVYSMWFGPESGKIMRKFLVDDQKSSDLQLEDDGRGLGDHMKNFSYSYIKPLGGSIGPKQTKCLVNITLDFFDLERAVSVTCSTQTPDVPSGNVFVTKTKYCLMWGPGNSTRIIMNCAVEWSGKSWLKGIYNLMPSK